MTTTPPETSDREYSAHELLRMDEQEARSTLTVNQFKRWEGVNDLHEQADENTAEWVEQAETVTDIAVHADMEQLGTEVDLFGNDVLVYVHDNDREFRNAVERLEREMEAVHGVEGLQDVETMDKDEVDALDDEEQRVLTDGMLDMLDVVLRRWNGHEWQTLPEDKRLAVLSQYAEEVGVYGVVAGWVRIGTAIREDQEEVFGAVESFRGETGTGDN